MKNRKIYTLLAIPALCSGLLLTSCGKSSVHDDPPMEPASYIGTVTGEDVYDTGYYCEETPSGKTVHIDIEYSDEKAGWSVYVADKGLSEDEIEALKEGEPALTGPGDIKIGSQVVYIFCDVNAKTSDKPTKDVLYICWTADYI